ncbi:MAG: hypothetical protein LGR52_11720 [Candidatus Thiosymbion ectosymbiont of Robbea hypermnestra]|nr:hypothetical protein [Candidatus Thiosymbion ectosymbiont of Robbea hypermnestra]
MKTEKHKADFVLCIENKDCDDLETGKVYQVVSDQNAVQEGYLRIIDESEEDYLYPASCFVPLSLPREAHRLSRSKNHSLRRMGSERSEPHR